MFQSRFAFIVAVASIGLFVSACSKNEEGNQSGAKPHVVKFLDLSVDDKARLDAQRAVVAEAAKQRYGATLNKTKDDLAILQRLIDDHVFSPDNTFQQESLGVVFGDVLASETPLHWVMVTDEYGTDPTLRYKDSTIQVSALTMILKRVEKGEKADVAYLASMIEKELPKLEIEIQMTQPGPKPGH